MSKPTQFDGQASDPEVPGGRDCQRLLDGIESHAVFMLNKTGEITTWPGPAERLYGYDRETVLGEHVRTLFADETAEGDDRAAEVFLADAREGTIEIEHWHERADGSVFWGSVTLSPLRDDTHQGYAVVCQDTTATKEYERMLERQNDRLKEFTDILAHDLRTPLGVIDQRLALFEETGDEEHVQSIAETTDRMARLVDDLLRVARQGGVVEDPESTDLGAVVETAWEGTGKAAGLSLRYEPIPRVSADPDRLCELFENLFRNAVEHGDGPVSVGPLDTGFYVADGGSGIQASMGESVFDHGVTTAEEGSGYGLSVVRTIVNAHGWDIVTAASEGGGARFEITGIEFLDDDSKGNEG